tara:strand:+ start:326 stop:2311 length:1986 start_codon:yes stop_codon:yes gene_type:complete
MQTITKYHWVLAALAVLLYISTYNFQYALDDKLVITGNQITKRGFDGIGLQFTHDAMDGFWAEQYGVQVEDYEGTNLVSGGRYRPLTMATHSVEYGLFGENPAISHLINALLYGVLALLVYGFLIRLFPQTKESWISVPFIIALIYVAHPLHVEVVANIKGRDELLSFLFAVLAMNVTIDAYKKQNITGYVLGGLAFFLSLMSKETTIPFLVLLPLVLYYINDNIDFKKLAIPTGVFFVTAIAYLGIRSAVIGETSLDPPNELMNNPFVQAVGMEKWATILLTVTAYIKLVFWPHPLTHDYYPFHLPFMAPEAHYPQISHWASLLGVVFLIAIIAYAFWGLMKKEKNSIGAWIFLGTIALVLNALFPVGVFMNERFMFIPSLGILIIFVAGLLKVKDIVPLRYAFVGLAIVFGVLTINRSYAWENDTTLALTDVEVSEGSAKSHMGAGDALVKVIKGMPEGPERNKKVQEAFTHLKKSLDIYPGYFPPLDLLAQLYFQSGNYKESIRFYKMCFDRKPGNISFAQNIVFIGNKLIELKRYSEAAQAFDEALSLKPDLVFALDRAAEVHGRYLNDPKKALEYLNRAVGVDPNNADILQKLGIIYAMTGNSTRAIEYFEAALKINPNNANVLNNLGITYIQIGEKAKGEQYIMQAKQMSTNLSK